MSASRSPSLPGSAVLALAAVADGGLTRSDLAALTDYTPEELDAHLAVGTGPSLRRQASRWTGEPIYLVNDPGQRQEILATAGQTTLDKCTEALHAWAEAYQQQGWPSTSPEYLLDGYFRLLESAGDLPRMIACATDRRRHEHLLDLTGGNAAALHEVTACQAAVEAQDIPDLATALLLAACRDWLVSQHGDLPADLPATLAVSGVPGLAEQLVSSIADPGRKMSAYTSMATTLIEHGQTERARHSLEQLVATIPTVTGHPQSHPAFDVVKELAAAGQWTSAERVARAVTSTLGRDFALQMLVAALAADGHLDQAEHLALSIDSGTITPRAEALKRVVAALASSGQVRHAEELARVFPGCNESRENGGFLALPELVAALAVAGEDEELHSLIRHAGRKQARDKLLARAVAAVARAGEFDRAERMARSASSEYDNREALAEIVDELLAAGEQDRAVALAWSVSTGNPSAAFPDLAGESGRQADSDLAAILRDLRRPRQKPNSGPPSPNSVAGQVKRALAHLEAGDLDSAAQIVRSYTTPAAARQVVRPVVASLAERAMADLAEQFADRLGDRRTRADALAATAAAAAAHGDASSARRLARRAIADARTPPEYGPIQFVHLAEAMLQAGETTLVPRLAERAVAFADTYNETYNNIELVWRAVAAAARAGAMSQAEEMARAFTPESAKHSGSIVPARKQLLTRLSSFTADASRQVSPTGPRRPAGPRDVPDVIQKSASLLKEEDDEEGAAQLIVEAKAHMSSASDPEPLGVGTTQLVTPDWTQKLLARALSRIGGRWHNLLSDIASMNPAAVRAVAEAIVDEATSPSLRSAQPPAGG